MAFVSSSYKVVQRNVGVSAKDIYSSCKNKWVWDWLSEKDVNKDYLSDYVKKVDIPGVAICWWCKEFFKYGSSGKKRLHRHSIQNKEKHKNKLLYMANTTIPSSWIDPSKIAEPYDTCERPCDLRYGMASNVHSSETCSTRRQPTARPVISVQDRVRSTEAFILSFAVENSLPLSKVPKLIEFARFLSKDVRALDEVKMDETTATPTTISMLNVDFSKTSSHTSKPATSKRKVHEEGQENPPRKKVKQISLLNFFKR